MGKLEKYTSYKDSGIDWLGSLPEHWDLLANKYIFKLKKDTVGKRSNEYDLLSLTLKGIIKRDMENPEGKFPAEFDTYQEVKKGDFVFCLFDVEETPRTVGLSTYSGMITGAYTVMETKNINKDYLYYFYLNLDSKKRLKPLYRGLRNTIPKDSFFSFKTFIPSIDEQTKISEYLDSKTSQIDSAISQKEKLIELLKEQKQITINDAVTKGLNKDIEFIDSDVEWIGEIPKHWKLERLGSNFIERKEKVSDKDFEPLSVTKNGVVPQLDSAAKSNDGDNRKLVRNGDFVINSRSDRKGSSGLSILDGSVSLINIVLKPIKIEPKFSHHVFKSYKFVEEFYRNGHGIVADLWTTRFWDMKSIMLAIPPREEQLQIVEYIENQTTKIDNAIKLQQNYISKLKEYKLSLIDSVVTGKVRVS